MKKAFRTIILAIMALSFGLQHNTAYAAFVSNMPVARLQPNGDTLHCFVTGDEFYHRLHDADGYTIIQNHANGWYVYADISWSDDHTDWELIPTALIAGQSNPAAAGLKANLIASPRIINALHKQWEIPARYALDNKHSSLSKNVRNHGKINNVVIFIRFADDTVITTPFSDIRDMFNDSSVNAVSMHNYFWRASYGNLRIPTYFYPTPDGDNIISYQDSLPRYRYMPYDSVTNPFGYHDRAERTNLEFSLLERAVNYVNQNSPVPTDLDIDYDNDGTVDNICFIVKGTYTGWNDLLWPHKWSLYDRNVYLNGKRVYTFNLQLEGSGSHYFSTSTFCHEMFHTLGAPDLYHYENYTNVTGVGIWDLMCNNTTPPQHMSVYMKMRYGRWLDSIPEITEAGTYTLNSVGDSIPNNICYRIQAGDPSQWYYIEYRDNTELFEEGLPGSGLIIYRTDSRFNGNSGFDRVNYFDEVYVFRPDAFEDTLNGNPPQAFFSLESGRTEFTPNTNPYPWLTDNVIDTTLYITNIGSAGETISFTYTPHRPATPQCDSTCDLTVEMFDQYSDTWNGAYLTFANNDGTVYSHLALGDCKSSEQRVVPVCSGEPVRVTFYDGSYPNECSYTIRLGDNSVWENNYGIIEDPCNENRQQYRINTFIASGCYNMGTVSGNGRYYEGDTAVLTATPFDGYRFDYWSSDDYIDDPTANPLYVICSNWDIPIRTYEAHFVRAEGIDDIESNIRIMTDNHVVTIEGAEGRKIEIFDAIGHRILHTTATSSSSSFTMPHVGLYIVRIESNQPRKVIIH